MERRIFIGKAKDVSINDSLVVRDSTLNIYFSKDFWKYFVKSHPNAAKQIFSTDVWLSQDVLKLQDTAWSYYIPSQEDKAHFTRTFANVPGDIERKDTVLPLVRRFVNGVDVSLLIQKESDRNWIVPQSNSLDSLTAGEFLRFKRLFTGHDTVGLFVVFFKKSLARESGTSPH